MKVILSANMGDTILVAGECYRLEGVSDLPKNHETTDVQGNYADCDQCEGAIASSSSPSGGSSSSGAGGSSSSGAGGSSSSGLSSSSTAAGSSSSGAALPFVTTWRTTGASEAIGLPLQSAGTYNFHVTWGDGTSDDITAWDAAARTHTYAVAGTYDVTITGTLTGWLFVADQYAPKITNIKSWGCLRLLPNYAGAFAGCTGLTWVHPTDVLDLTGVISLNSFFQNCTNLTTVDYMDLWHVGSVLSMAWMFRDAPAFDHPLIGNWDVSNVVNMYEMFRGAANFGGALTYWNTGAVQNMVRMFHGATSFNLPVNHLNVSRVTDMTEMFYGATAFNQPVAAWNTVRVQDMRDIFQNAAAFNQNISTWNVTGLLGSAEIGLLNSGMSVANYSAALTAWAGQFVQSGVYLKATSKYNIGAQAARTHLINVKLWSILDGGLE